MDTALLMETLKQPMWQYYISVVLVAVPLVRIFRRAGLEPLLVGTLFIPWAGVLVTAYILAFRSWPKVVPREKKKREKHA